MGTALALIVSMASALYSAGVAAVVGAQFIEGRTMGDVGESPRGRPSRENGAAPDQTQTAFSNADVAKMLAAGLDSEVITVAVETAVVTNFDTSPTALVELRRQGASAAILKAMLGAKTRPGDNSTGGLSLEARVAPVLTRQGAGGPLSAIRVRTETVTPELSRKFGLGPKIRAVTLAVVTSVLQESEAGRAGVRIGDIVWGVVNAEVGAGIQTAEAFERASPLCPVDCLLSVLHADGAATNGFLPLGPVENSFKILTEGRNSALVAYRSRRAALTVMRTRSGSEDDRRWYFRQAFGDERRPEPGALALVGETGEWVWITSKGVKPPMVRLDQ